MKHLNEEDNQPRKRKVGRSKKQKNDHNCKASSSRDNSPTLDPIHENSREVEDSDLAQSSPRDLPITLAHENLGEEEDCDYVQSSSRDPVQIAHPLTFENSEELDVAEMSLCNNANQSQPEDPLYGYEVNAEFMPTLRKIITKHGNIVERCGTMLVRDRSILLEMVCKILHDFQNMRLTDVTKRFVESKIVLVEGLQKGMELDLDWLRISLAELLDAIEIQDNINILQGERDSRNKNIEEIECELKGLQKDEMEVKEKIEKLSKNLNDICAKKSKIGRSKE